MNPNEKMTPGLEHQAPLRLWFSKMNDDDKLVIETHILDGVSASMDCILDTVRDEEKARGIMHMIRTYIDSRNNKKSAEELRRQAKEISEHIERVIEETA